MGLGKVPQVNEFLQGGENTGRKKSGALRRFSVEE
jgi:hypothetical protein